MSASQVEHFRNEFGGEEVDVYQADAAGSLPANRTLTVDDGKGPKLVLVLSEPDAARLCGALLPAAWWEALLRQSYRMGWSEGAQETGGVDRHGIDSVHPKEDDVIKRLLAVGPT
jgi:hypothetical protein